MPRGAALALAQGGPPHKEAARPLYRRAWFWGTLAGLAAAGVVAGVTAGVLTRPAEAIPTPGGMMGVTITPVF